MVHVVIVHLRVVYDVIHLTLNGPSCFEENLKLEQKKFKRNYLKDYCQLRSDLYSSIERANTRLSICSYEALLARGPVLQNFS